MKQAPSFWKSPAALVLAVAAAFGGFLLYQEHEAHLWGFLPYLILLACPLLHLFMHRGHKGGDHSTHHQHERRGDE